MSLLRSLARERRAQAGGVIGGALLLLLVGGLLVVSVDPTTIDVANRFAGPSPAHLFGTDELGRDVLSRIIHGGFASLEIAAGAVAIAAAIGIFVGLPSGYIGGFLDLMVMRFTDLFFAIPGLLTTIGIVALLGPGQLTTMLAIGVGFSPLYARVVRSAVVGTRGLTYVDASRVMGASTLRVIRLDILPAIAPVLLVHTAAELGYAILAEAGLGFLGIGIQAPAPSWGSMLASSRAYIHEGPWLGVIAGAFVVLTVFSINLIGDALGDALDPRSVRRAM